MGARPSSFKNTSQVEDAPVVHTKPGRVWAPEQERIFDWFGDGVFDGLVENPNLVIDAVAGSGKTTTLIEGVKRMPEKNPIICAFNKKIAQELNDRLVDSYATARTLHSLGYAAVRRKWRGIGVADGNDRADELTAKVIEPSTPKPIARLISKLHTHAREMMPLSATADTMLGLAFRFNCVPDEGWRGYDAGYVASCALAAMEVAAKDAPSRATGIDYADMLFLPLAWNLASKDYDAGVVDETQDMTLAQLELMQRSIDGRIAIVGDKHQAIYGFRGADTGGMDRLRKELGATSLPLYKSYRCATRIIERAQTLVPHIHAVDGAPEGEVTEDSLRSLFEEAGPGDFVLSRLNAPLVAITFKFLRDGKRARMRGRNIGENIQKIIRKLAPTSLRDLNDKVERWGNKLITSLAQYGQLDQIAAVRDQQEMIIAFAAEVDSLSQLDDKLNYLFTDVAEEDTIICSTVHKAKGLETDRVWLYAPSFYRKGRTQEEDNIAYVAITRAKTRLVYVDAHELMHP